MNPISSKVIREFHLYKDETVTKLASQNGINSVPHLLVDFFCHARAFSKVPPLMRISPTITSGTPLTLMYRTKSKIFSAISFGVVARRDECKRVEERTGARLLGRLYWGAELAFPGADPGISKRGGAVPAR